MCKYEIRNSKSEINFLIQIFWISLVQFLLLIYSMAANSGKKYDLEERTYIFTKNVIGYVDKLPRRITNSEIGKQLIRSSGSVGANYIEANEALSKKDFLMRIKICRKEAKESHYWLKLSSPLKHYENDKFVLMVESTELMKIFASIMHKVNV